MARFPVLERGASGFDRTVLHPRIGLEQRSFAEMRRVQLLFAVLGAALAGLAAPAADAAELPAGANSALVAKQCAGCHDLQPLFDAAGVSRDDWNGALDEMVGYGLKVTPEERAQILEYLATYLGPSAKVAK
jgi:hypothetical protein